MTTTLRWTSADLEHFPDDGKRREIIDGELYVSKQPDWYHQVVCSRLGGLLDAWSLPLQTGQAAIAPGVIFADDDDVAPDVVWVSRARLTTILAGGKLHAAPELVIEVLSPGKKNEQRDRETKLKLYARHGVEEYWIVAWPLHTIDIFRRDGEQLIAAASLGPGNTLASPLLPGFSVPLERVFAGIPQDAVDEG